MPSTPKGPSVTEVETSTHLKNAEFLPSTPHNNAFPANDALAVINGSSSDHSSPSTPVGISATKNTFLKRALAKDMARSGYATNIIHIETGLTEKQIRGIYTNLEDEEGFDSGANKKATSRRKVSSILSSQISKQHASVLLRFYLTFAGNKFTVARNVKVGALTKAYDTYCNTIDEISRFSTTNDKFKLSISDGWSLAAALRSDEAYIVDCRNCRASYVSSIEQDTFIECPFCFND